MLRLGQYGPRARCSGLRAQRGNGSAAIQTALDSVPPGRSSCSRRHIHRQQLRARSQLDHAARGRRPRDDPKEDERRAPRTSPMQPSIPTRTRTSPAGHHRRPLALAEGRHDIAGTCSADGVKGANSVTVSNASGFAAGQFVLLDELSGASGSRLPRVSPDNAQGVAGRHVAWNMHCRAAVSGRQRQFERVRAVRSTPGRLRRRCRGSHGPIDPRMRSKKSRRSPATPDVRHAAPHQLSDSHGAQLTATAAPTRQVKHAGVENFTSFGGADGQIRFENAAYSWAMNIENTQWIGEGFAVNGSFRIEIRDSYMHTGRGQSRAARATRSALPRRRRVLVENNIIVDTCKIMVVRSSGAGSVFGYNYTDDSWDATTRRGSKSASTRRTWQARTTSCSKATTRPTLDSDYTHGNAIDLTFFRNWLSGQRRELHRHSNLRAVGLAYGSWWDSFVGNVLGRPGQMRLDVCVFDRLSGVTTLASRSALRCGRQHRQRESLNPGDQRRRQPIAFESRATDPRPRPSGTGTTTTSRTRSLARHRGKGYRAHQP